jgi:uncharacterized repeat protein (TIGR01451 family)
MTTAAGAALLLTLLTGCNPRQPWHSQMITPDDAYYVGGNSGFFVFSPDGTKLAFDSLADGMVPDDANGRADVFVYDLATGETSLVSATPNGGSGNGDSSTPVFSPDSSELAFGSTATDLDPAVTDANGQVDIYIRDLASGTTTLLTTDASGDTAANSDSGAPSFSPDGTKIAFYSDGSDLGPNDTNEDWDVYLRDRATGTTSLVSATADGTDAARGEEPQFSPDGTKIAYRSAGSGHGPVDTNETWDAYVFDLATGTTSLVSVNSGGTDSGNGTTFLPRWSPDSSQLVFYSWATDLTTLPGGIGQVYLRDLDSETTSLVSTNAAGTAGGNFGAQDPAFSPSGDQILFGSSSTNLGPTDTNGQIDLYLRDLTTGTTSLVSVDKTGTRAGNGETAFGSFDETGDRVTFASNASDLGPTDTHVDPVDPGQGADIYMRDLASGTTTMVSADAAGTGAGNDISVYPHFRPGHLQVAFISRGDNYGPTDTNGVTDLYLATYRAADLGVELDASPEPVASGGQLTYEVTLTNDGPDTADDTTVGLLLPARTTFDGATTSAGTCTAPTPAHPDVVTCDVGDVADGDTVEVTVTGDVAAPTGSSLTALASARSGTADVSSDDNTVAATSTVG